MIAVKAIAGETGIASGLDYRGEKVLAHIHPVAGTSWFMINKIDEFEALSEWNAFARVTILLFCFLGIASIAIAAFLWQSLRKKHFESLYSAQAEISRAEERYKTTLLSVGDGVISTDSEGRVEFMNSVAEGLTGWTLSECRKRPLEEIFVIVNEMTRAKIESPVRQVLEKGVIVGLANHTVLICRDGREYPIADSGSPIRSESGEIVGVVLVFRDQSEDRAVRNALQKSEKQLRNINDSSIDFIYSYDLEGRFTSVNRSLCESMGYAADKIIGKTHAELGFPAETCLEWATLHRRVLETKKTVCAETSTSILPSAMKYWEVILNPLCDDGENVVGISGITRDVTANRIARMALSESEARLAAFMEYVPSLVLIRNAELRTVYANRKARELFPVDEWMGKRPEEIYDTDTASLAVKRDIEAMENGIVEFESEIMDMHGEIHSFLNTIFRIDIPDRPPAVGMITTDITERKKIGLQLAEFGEVFRLFLAHSPIYLFIKDKDGRTAYLSDNYSDMLGIPAADAIGKTMDQIFPREVAAPMMEADRRIMQEGMVVEIVEEMAGKTYSTIKFPIVIKNESKYLAGYTMDITEQVQTTRAIRKVNDSLEEKVRERTALLSAANRELEAFSFSVSHDLRSPLRALDGFSNSLALQYADRLDSQGLHYLERIQNGARRMGQLITDLLAMSQVTRSGFERKEENLSAIAARAISDLRSESPDRMVDVDIEPDMIVQGDGNLLAIAMANLAGNAWKFSGLTKNAHIWIGSRRVPGDAGRTEYFVRDNGAGFDMSYADKLFKPFQRLHGVNEFSGTGIGLATVQRIIARHGGEIRAEASPGQGACFIFTLAASVDANQPD